MENIMKQTIALKNITQYAAPAGRVLLAAIFVSAGASKITSYTGTQGYMEAFGVPGVLLPLVIALEIGVGLSLAVGFKARLAAFLLAGFSLVSALIFHSNLSDQVQFLFFMKNVAISGGLLMIVAHGAGTLAFDKE